ncbi:nitric oxide reductase activation protein NorD [Desulforhopalus sp. IMCC35007]|uniref:nitric oxide reductase activation protein NorD n=1 Tax=Desulforhopalus sp. IMCC35007 TaxID=2569543 RepID=UPI0010AE3159|nr:VWA domain-containing protein [Desulforhopalus sp. IMCC35007]TKB09134.1 VWA domain-containing protein [Desulforhopalus sp. IMCC35007]
MRLDILKERFFELVAPSLPNEWEVDEVLYPVQKLDDESIDNLLDQVSVIWPVSHSLCFAYLTDAVHCVDLIPSGLMTEWSRQILSLYESGGLVAARKFMAEPEKMFLDPFDGLSGVSFSQISSRMQLYLNGISGRRIELVEAPVPQTDTLRIFIPDHLEVFTGQSENTLLYKLLISLQWGHIDSRVFEDSLAFSSTGAGGSHFDFSSYSDRDKAWELFAVLQFVKVFAGLSDTLPGLIRGSRRLCLQLVDSLLATGNSLEYCNLLKAILLRSITEEKERENSADYLDRRLCQILDRLVVDNAFALLPDFYSYFSTIPGSCDFGSFSLLLGEFDFSAATTVISERRKAEMNAFVALMALALQEKEKDRLTNQEQSTMESIAEQADATLLVVKNEDSSQKQQPLRADLLLDNGGEDLSEELKALISDIEGDLGELPEAYVQAATGMAGRGVNSREAVESKIEYQGEGLGRGGHAYDEWDYRRGGYRSAWCTLYEKAITPVSSNFIEETLSKYKGQLYRIRRQFEMLRTQNRFVRRRRYGDEIDFDALVDAVGDAKAGLVPSDRLFLRLLRNQREISTYFLVDMSNSTEGWVGTAVKEALVLMAEALEIVGDPYAVYGFSGMRRSKSEVFPVKELQEVYGERVRGRIAAISPKEYTRMGPPIRHIIQKMIRSDSKIRLLIVFSDGKPEDYDDYKGAYAIEDTKKALLEARGAGIHVFCVTIDKQAHEYLGHMFGRGHYIFIDNVDVLPGKLVELYRLLTR